MLRWLCSHLWSNLRSLRLPPEEAARGGGVGGEGNQTTPRTYTQNRSDEEVNGFKNFKTQQHHHHHQPTTHTHTPVEMCSPGRPQEETASPPPHELSWRTVAQRELPEEDNNQKQKNKKKNKPESIQHPLAASTGCGRDGPHEPGAPASIIKSFAGCGGHPLSSRRAPSQRNAVDSGSGKRLTGGFLS